METVRIKSSYIGLLSFFFLVLLFLIPQNNFAQEKSKDQIYKDELYKFQFSYPANFVFNKVNNEYTQFRDKKDIASTTRISVTVVNFETTTSTGKLYDFAQFARVHAKKIYSKNNVDNSDSLMVKDYVSGKTIKGKEVYVRLFTNAQQSSSGKEEQVIKGPVFIFDISARTGIPGTALVLYQVTDDSRSSKILRSIVDDLGF